MGYTITLSDDGEYIVLKVTGFISRESAMRQNLEAHALGRRLQIDRYLVDLREARNVESPAEAYDFAYKDMQLAEGIDLNAIVATLVSPDDHSHDFIETVSRNAGLNVTLFTDLDLAKQHLKHAKSVRRFPAEHPEDQSDEMPDA